MTDGVMLAVKKLRVKGVHYLALEKGTKGEIIYCHVLMQTMAST